RAKSISSLFDALISVIPSECSLYEGTRLKCYFVGHPVLDLVEPVLTREEFRPECAASVGMLMGMMPGSRKEEVKRILPVMLNCARIIKGELQEVSFAVAVADSIETELVKSLCHSIFADVSIVKGRTHEVMQASDLLMVASGTATLEAAVLGVPMSIIYRTSPLTWALAKGLVRVKSIGLVNIIAGRRVVPEFIQFDATPERLSQQILSLVKDPARIEKMKEDLRKVRERLGTPGASKRAARLVVELSEET
ncbi:MAG: lipid-A-disaccharide synthase, partial [bacterium]